MTRPWALFRTWLSVEWGRPWREIAPAVTSSELTELFAYHQVIVLGHRPKEKKDVCGMIKAWAKSRS